MDWPKEKPGQCGHTGTGPEATDASNVTRKFSTVDLSEDQRHAMHELLEFDANATPVHALSGPAGSGKTTLVGEFVRRCTRNVEATATTNKAARVAAQMTGTEPKTIHSLLGLQPRNDDHLGRATLKQVREPEIEPGTLVIVDECSMIDSELLLKIKQHACALRFKVLFVGDAYQLPPVHESQSPVFAGVPTSHLTTIHRQALDNPVLAFANEFRATLDGAGMPRVRPMGHQVVTLDPDAFVGRMLDVFAWSAGRHSVKALAYTNERVHELNQVIRRHLIGPEADERAHLPGERFIANTAIKVGERLVVPTEGEVVIVSSEPAWFQVGEVIFAGENVKVRYLGEVLDLHVPTDWPRAHQALRVVAQTANGLQRRYRAGEYQVDAERRAAWRTFFAAKEWLHDLRPVHASTVHKSQGSTYQHAFIDAGDIGRCTRADVLARLMYVAVSRAAHTVTLTGLLPDRLYGVAA